LERAKFPCFQESIPPPPFLPFESIVKFGNFEDWRTLPATLLLRNLSCYFIPVSFRESGAWLKEVSLYGLLLRVRERSFEFFPYRNAHDVSPGFGKQNFPRLPPFLPPSAPFFFLSGKICTRSFSVTIVRGRIGGYLFLFKEVGSSTSQSRTESSLSPLRLRE